jgi:hypothetical protein
VRELANAMERVALLSESDTISAALLDFRSSEPAGRSHDSGPIVAGSLDERA